MTAPMPIRPRRLARSDHPADCDPLLISMAFTISTVPFASIRHSWYEETLEGGILSPVLASMPGSIGLQDDGG